MRTRFTHVRARPLWRVAGRVGVLGCFLAWVLAGCTTPGAVAPSTKPISGNYVELGPAEEVDSCGYTVLFIPVKNPKPVADLLEDLIKNRGGDALVEVTSSSSTTFYLLGVANCVQIKGKVVSFTR
jgi:hypothetical protein